MSSYTKNFRNTTRAAFGTAPDCSTPLPADFDPQQHPILSQHWFGIQPSAQPIDGACLLSTKEAA